MEISYGLNSGDQQFDKVTQLQNIKAE